MWVFCPCSGLFNVFWSVGLQLHHIWKNFELLVWWFSTLAVRNANVWPCVTSELFTLPFSSHSLPCLMEHHLYTDGLVLSRDVLVTALHISRGFLCLTPWSWTHPPHIPFALISSNTDLHFLNLHCWPLCSFFLRP